jgi:enediyne core biosynthesis thioesterase
MGMDHERRKHQRIQKKYPIRVKLNNADEWETHAVNISEGGLLMEWENDPALISPLTHQRKLRVTIELPEENQIVESEVDVARVQKIREWEEDSKYYVGLQFAGMEERYQHSLLQHLVKSNERRSQQFIYEKTVYLADTNLEGNVYFANYFKWQGEAREEFYRQYFPLQLWQTGMKIITVDAHMDYKHETFFYDVVAIQIYVQHIRNMSLEMKFIFRHKQTNALLAVGSQRIAFAGPDGKLIPIPPEIKQIAGGFVE